MPLPRTRITGVIPRRPQVADRGGLTTGRTRLRRRSSRREPPRCFYPRPGLLLPHLDRAVIALDRPARADLAGPAAPVQQVPDPRDGVLHPELAGHQVADPGQRPPLVFPPGGQRPGLQRQVQRGQLPLIQPALRRLPAGGQPGRPAACQACRHRRTDRSLTRSSAAITAAGAPCSNLLAASSRTSSRRLRPSAVSPPPCAYRMHPAYRRSRPRQPRGHHQLKVC